MPTDRFAAVTGHASSDDAASAIELSVVVPFMNEEDNIGRMIERVMEALKDFGKPWELIVIDDGSTDRTLSRAQTYIGREGLDLKIIEFQRNFGQAAGLQAGFDAARGRLIASLDGDLQNDPHDIPGMIAELESRDLDLLCGWRKARQDALVLRKILLVRQPADRQGDWRAHPRLWLRAEAVPRPDHQTDQHYGRHAPLHPGLGGQRHSVIANRRDRGQSPCPPVRHLEIRYFPHRPRRA